MKLLIGMLLGYCVHDAVKPTAVGKVLDSVALPSDTFVKSADPQPKT